MSIFNRNTCWIGIQVLIYLQLLKQLNLPCRCISFAGVWVLRRSSPQFSHQFVLKYMEMSYIPIGFLQAIQLCNDDDWRSSFSQYALLHPVECISLLGSILIWIARMQDTMNSEDIETLLWLCYWKDAQKYGTLKDLDLTSNCFPPSGRKRAKFLLNHHNDVNP